MTSKELRQDISISVFGGTLLPILQSYADSGELLESPVSISRAGLLVPQDFIPSRDLRLSEFANAIDFGDGPSLLSM